MKTPASYTTKDKALQASTFREQKSNGWAFGGFQDNRSSSITQRKLQRQIQAATANEPMRKPFSGRQGGLPMNLKSSIEQLSGYSMDDVKVHYNSDKPAQLQAHAYAEGTDIHLASGQEKHLPHEAWHVVQQKQGRVRPTVQLGGAQINDDIGLEREADLMGDKAMQMKSFQTATPPTSPGPLTQTSTSKLRHKQTSTVIQRVLYGIWNAENVSNLGRVIPEIIRQISSLIVRDPHIVLNVTEILRGGTDAEEIEYLKRILHREYDGYWNVSVTHVGRTSLGGREEFSLVISNFTAESERLRLPHDSDYRSAVVTSWESSRGTPHKIAGYHAFGPGNPDRAATTIAVRAAIRREGIPLAVGDWNMAPPPSTPRSEVVVPYGHTTAGGNVYDYGFVDPRAAIGMEGLTSGFFHGSDHKLIFAKVGEKSRSGRLIFSRPR